MDGRTGLRHDDSGDFAVSRLSLVMLLSAETLRLEDGPYED